MGTKNNIETQIDSVLEILNKITINDKTIEKEITGQLYLIIDKFIKNKIKRKNFMEKLKMKNTLLREYGNAIKKESKQEGIIEGKLKGKKEGIIEEKFSVAKNLIKENIPLKTIMKTTNLTKEEIESLK